jgi:hypothetical protein
MHHAEMPMRREMPGHDKQPQPQETCLQFQFQIPVPDKTRNNTTVNRLEPKGLQLGIYHTQRTSIGLLLGNESVSITLI